jgi:hypothetical protein
MWAKKTRDKIPAVFLLRGSRTAEPALPGWNTVRKQVQFVPLSEWGFTTRRQSGPEYMVTIRKYGLIEVGTIYTKW